MKHWRWLAILFVSTPVFGVDLINTLSDTANSARAITGVSEIAGSFINGNDPFSVNQVVVKLANPSAGTGTASFYIYDATGTAGRPNTSLGFLGSLNMASISASYTDYTFNGFNIALNPNTTYWLVASGSTDTFRSVSWQTVTTTTNTTFSNYFDSTGVWSPPSTTYKMAFSVSGSVVPVPEPRTYVTAAIGAVVLTIVYMRKRTCI